MTQFPFYHCAVDDPNTPRSVYTAIGRAAAAWARLEQHLDAVLFQVNKRRHSESLYEEHPRDFARKLKLLKKWFNKCPALAVHKQEMAALTRNLRVLSREFRNPMLHSIFARYDPQKQVLDFCSIRSMGGDNFNIRETRTDMQRLRKAPKTLNQANEILSWISRDLFSPDGIARLEKP